MNQFKAICSLANQQKNLQKGISLLEAMLGVAIVSASLLLVYQLQAAYGESTKQSLAAQQQESFAIAAKAHIKDNYQSIAASLQSGTQIHKISAADLAEAGRLPVGSNGVNAFGHHMCAIVRLMPGLTPDSLPQLQSLVVAEGGEALDDVSLGRVASQIGGSGGGVYLKDDQFILGTHSSWRLPISVFSGINNQSGANCLDSSGPVLLTSGRPVSALWFENADVSTSFLSRDEVPGLPSLNTMQTPILLGEGAKAIDGSSCRPTQKGAIARDEEGKLLSCLAPEFRWRQATNIFWADPVEQASWLSGSGAVFGQVRIDLETGQPNYYNGSPGSGWSNLFVSPSGNLSIGTQGIHATGSDNAFVGIDTAPPNAEGSGNVHLGNRSGGKSVSGWGNTYLGTNISTESTGSTSNTIVGYNAGMNNRVTSGNTFSGASSGAANQNGNNNTFYGAGSGANTLSSNNNFFGYNADFNNRTGLGNAYFGDWSGRANAQGNQNVFLGQYAGADLRVDNSVAIGYGAVVTDSNAIQIGNHATAYDIRLGGANSTVTATRFLGDLTGTVTTPSDRRLKTEIKDASRGLSFVKKLRPVEYVMDNKEASPQNGFIAQEVELIDPNFSAIKKPLKAEDFYSINYSEFIPLIVKAIQELDEKISRENEKPSSHTPLGGGFYLLAALCTALFLALILMSVQMRAMNRRIAALEFGQQKLLGQTGGALA